MPPSAAPLTPQTPEEPKAGSVRGGAKAVEPLPREGIGMGSEIGQADKNGLSLSAFPIAILPSGMPESVPSPWVAGSGPTARGRRGCPPLGAVPSPAAPPAIPLAPVAAARCRSSARRRRAAGSGPTAAAGDAPAPVRESLRHPPPQA